MYSTEPEESKPAEDTELWRDTIRIQYEQNISWSEARRVARASAFLKARKERRIQEQQNKNNQSN